MLTESILTDYIAWSWWQCIPCLSTCHGEGSVWSTSVSLEQCSVQGLKITDSSQCNCLQNCNV